MLCVVWAELSILSNGRAAAALNGKQEEKLVKAFAMLDEPEEERERKANFIFQTCFASRSNFAENFFSSTPVL